jgi:hypothetical protein
VRETISIAGTLRDGELVQSLERIVAESEAMVESVCMVFRTTEWGDDAEV